MRIRTISSLIVSTAMLTSIALAPSPATATEPDPRFAHARCSMRTLDATPAQTELRKIRVSLSDWHGWTPGSKVGWRFVLYRYGERVYRSPKQITIADEKGTLDFTPMAVTVAVPPWLDDGDSVEYRYEATIVTIFYESDGSVSRTQRTPVPTYKIWVDGHFSYDDYSCNGRQKV